MIGSPWDLSLDFLVPFLHQRPSQYHQLPSSIYADDTIISSRINSKSDESDEVRLADDLENDLQLVVNWENKRIVNFKAFNTKLASLIIIVNLFFLFH